MGKRSFSSFLYNFSRRRRRNKSSASTKINRAEKEQLSPSLITLLPDDIIIDILARVPRCDYPTLSIVSKHFQSLLFLPELYTRRSLLGFTKVKESECCFSVPEAKGSCWGNNEETIFVKGFDSSLARVDIKVVLRKHFGSCGQVIRVFVPIECKTGACLGFAFINMKNKDDVEKALALDGSDLGGRKLEVMMAKDRDEQIYPFPDFKGCGICRSREFTMHMQKWYYETHGGRIRPGRGFFFGSKKETWINPFFKRDPIIKCK